MKSTIILCLFLTIGIVLPAHSGNLRQPNPKVEIITNMGSVVVELFPEKAPRTVSNFLNYVRSQFYDGTIFHRVIPGFMIQGGGLDKDLNKKETGKPIINEAYNGLKNIRGTVAMARTSFPHSATSQFFINLADNTFLDFKSKTKAGWGYCVFGKVLKGMEVVDSIAKVKTGSFHGRNNVPLEPVIIKKIRLQERKVKLKKGTSPFLAGNCQAARWSNF